MLRFRFGLVQHPVNSFGTAANWCSRPGVDSRQRPLPGFPEWHRRVEAACTRRPKDAVGRLPSVERPPAGAGLAPKSWSKGATEHF